MQKTLSLILINGIILLGLLIFSFPFASGEKAYFIGENYFLNLKDSIEIKYPDYLYSLAEKNQRALAFEKKKVLRDQLVPKSDSLERVAIEAKESKNFELAEKVNVAKKELNKELNEKELAIDEEFDFSNFSEEEKDETINSLKQENNIESYLLKYANDVYNPTGNSDIKKVAREDLILKTVNQQSYAPFIIAGLILMAIGIFVWAYFEGKISFASKSFRLIAYAVLGALVIIFSALIYFSFASKIEFEKTLAQREEVVKQRLIQAKNLQMAYFESKKKYSSKWEDLIAFAKNDSVKIVKYLVNKDDTAAVNQATREGRPLESIKYVSVKEKVFPNEEINFDQISIVPFSDEEFEINAGVIDKNGRDIHVFEIKTSKYTFIQNLKYIPENFDRSKELILGSMREPTTEGNW